MKSEPKPATKSKRRRKVADDAPPVDSWRTLRGRHAWLTEDGAVLIEVRGDTILISESLNEETTKRAETDFWDEPKADKR